MRAAWVVVSLAIALVAQLSVLNGLHLPGGGVPDLMLVLVAALAMASGPVNGMFIGFAAGLCVDLAPPGSEVVGQYALVFCLVGWAAGRLAPVPGHSARHSAGLVATALLALVVGGAEVLAVIVGKLVAPSTAAIGLGGLVLPSTIIYDWVLGPLVLSLVMLAGTLFAERSDLVGAQALAGTRRSRRAAMRAQRLPELHLEREAGRLGAGWLSMSRPAAQPAKRHARRAPARLRPAAGVPGSSSGLRR
ncbi:MAG: rod shape-determining protein MreD, partial [Actinobacteria bacterium]|nr:rod shape-determining protein MreD [Actinomycetota bacterium]